MRFPLRIRAFLMNSGIACASAVVLSAVMAGCDPGAGPTMSAEENKAAVEARNKGVADGEKKAADALAKKGKGGGGMKSIKGGLKVPE